MKVPVPCTRRVQVAYFTLHHTGYTPVSPSTWVKRVPRVVKATNPSLSQYLPLPSLQPPPSLGPYHLHRRVSYPEHNTAQILQHLDWALPQHHHHIVDYESERHRRNVIRTLIPNTPSTQLHTPPPNTTYHSNTKSLQQALKHRNKALTTLLKETKQWLIDNPSSNLHRLIATSTSKPWNEPPSTYSTSSTNPHHLHFPSPTNGRVINK